MFSTPCFPVQDMELIAFLSLQVTIDVRSPDAGVVESVSLRRNLSATTA